MPIMITPAQYAALETRELRAFAAEVARTLAALFVARPAIPMQHATPEFAFEQLERARKNGLKRRNEMMAWALCAGVHGAGFEDRLPEVRQIVAERNYDRSVLLTLLATHGLQQAGSAA